MARRRRNKVKARGHGGTKEKALKGTWPGGEKLPLPFGDSEKVNEGKGTRFRLHRRDQQRSEVRQKDEIWRVPLGVQDEANRPGQALLQEDARAEIRRAGLQVIPGGGGGSAPGFALPGGHPSSGVTQGPGLTGPL